MVSLAMHLCSSRVWSITSFNRSEDSTFPPRTSSPARFTLASRIAERAARKAATAACCASVMHASSRADFTARSGYKPFSATLTRTPAFLSASATASGNVGSTCTERMPAFRTTATAHADVDRLFSAGISSAMGVQTMTFEASCCARPYSSIGTTRCLPAPPASRNTTGSTGTNPLAYRKLAALPDPSTLNRAVDDFFICTCNSIEVEVFCPFLRVFNRRYPWNYLRTRD